MGIARSTYYDVSAAKLDDTALVEAIATICEEFELKSFGRFGVERDAALPGRFFKARSQRLTNTKLDLSGCGLVAGRHHSSSPSG
jgi:hypothetical protein